MLTFGTRVVAVLLIIGGAMGALSTLYSGYGLAMQHWIYGPLFLLFSALFIYSTITGIRLWKGNPKGYKWATILFASQIPVFTFPGAAYEWFTGLAYKFMFGGVGENTILSFGSNFNFYLDTRITEVSFGVNIIAIVAFLFLAIARSNPSFKRDWLKPAP
jgi:hypothetical protein